MSDIVKRLAKCAALYERNYIIKDNPKLYYDAMYEIERLRAENEKLREAFLYEYPVRYIKGDLAIADDRISELETENIKLRNALKECAQDLEVEINARYKIDGKVHPALQHKYDRDMAPVRDAAALLESGDE